MVKRNIVEKVFLSIVGILIIFALISALSSQLGDWMRIIFYIFGLLMVLAIILKVIDILDKKHIF